MPRDRTAQDKPFPKIQMPSRSVANRRVRCVKVFAAPCSGMMAVLGDRP